MLIEKLHEQSKVDVKKLEWIAETASSRYKTYEVDKRSGGTRTIEHPSRELKAVQKWISNFLFRKFPVHECATAYSKGSSIRSNAEKHLLTNYTVRLDFRDFFPSFKFRHIANFLHKQNDKNRYGLTQRDIGFMSAIVTRHGRLTIGAPSSPVLSNSLMYGFDCEVKNFADRRNLVYTRYADDVFISSEESHSMRDVVKVITEISNRYTECDLRLNPKKTVHLSRRYNRTITGLVLTPDRKISLGRERKRHIKSLVFQSTLNGLDANQLSHLSGLLAFASGVEPAFLTSLERKYNQDTIDGLLKRRRKPLKHVDVPWVGDLLNG